MKRYNTEGTQPAVCDMKRGSFLLLLLFGACNPSSGGSSALNPSPSMEKASEPVPEAALPVGPEIVSAPDTLEGSLSAYVKRMRAEVSAEGRTLIVYVGAMWCEPCKRFHDALKAGELQASLPRVTFLEFDYDLHRRGLQEAGYLTRMVPSFAIPTPEGKSSGRLHQGAVKGPGAVDFIVPKVKALLAVE